MYASLQVEELHRVLARQHVLARAIRLPKGVDLQAAFPTKREADASGGAAADPRTVLVSHFGNGSGGSQPSTDQGSWPQVRICLKRIIDLSCLRHIRAALSRHSPHLPPR